MGILLRLAGYALRISPFRLVLAYVCLIGSTLLSLAISRLLGISIDRVLESGDSSVLMSASATVLLISLAAGAFHYGQTYLSEYISQHVAYQLRHNFLARLQALSYGFHDRHKTGDLMSRAAADVAHTNGIESHWAMLKRGYVGVYHQMSVKHLPRYVAEFEGRHNSRPMDTAEQMCIMARGANGKRMTYVELTA